MGSLQTSNVMVLETSCGYLLQELQIIWDEVGEDQFERQKVLLELEQECLQVYRRKVDSANVLRARLHQQLAQSEAEFTHLLIVLGERSVPARPEKIAGTLKRQLDSIAPALREMQLRKEDRVKQFRLIQGQIHKISSEIAGMNEYNDSSTAAPVNEDDLSFKRLEEHQDELQRLQNEKRNRLERVEKYIKTIKNLSAILGNDSSLIITKVHPSLNEFSGLSKNISDDILQMLDSIVKSLELEKQTRLEKLQHLGETLADLWNFMRIPHEDRRKFIHLCSLSSMVSANISTPRNLTLEIIQQAETEVMRLDQLKASKMKELIFRKHIDLEEICSRSHMEVPSRPAMEKVILQIDSGEIDPIDLLRNMDEQITRAEEEAVSRKVITEKVEKWILARDEELWLEEYSTDENRYAVSRGAHKNLRRAEGARMMVNKIPALVDLLISKTQGWEDEQNKVFLYDEVPLLAMLEEYNTVRKEKEVEKQRQREQKKGQMRTTDNKSPFGARPGTSIRHTSHKSSIRGIGSASPPNRKLPTGLGPNSISPSPLSLSSVKGRKANNQKGFVDNLREDTVSVFSSFSGPFSP